MTPDQIDRVFGCGRLRMVTGDHVEVFREAAAEGERRRYTKRFLDTRDGDFGQWTEREWRILARLIGHGIDCVPEVVQFDRGAQGGAQLVQTYDAGATVDQWATILPVERDGLVLRHVFEDCAHWWALAHHSLRALSAIHELSVVHLDIKGDNVCIPVGPPGFDPHARDARLHPRFDALALIDFAFALISRERLTTALPIGWQVDYDYQSPRLLQALEAGRRGDLQPTRELDWRCDMYSLAAMLKRYLPSEDQVYESRGVTGWTAEHASAAKDLVLALRDAHDRDAPHVRPHQLLMAMTSSRLAEAEAARPLAAGWRLARDAAITPVAASPITPLTRLAPSLRVMVSPRASMPLHAVTVPIEPVVMRRRPDVPKTKPHRALVIAALSVLVTAGVAAMVAPAILSHFEWPADEAVAPADTQKDDAQKPEAPRAEAPKPDASSPEPQASAPSPSDAPPARADKVAAPAAPATTARTPSRTARPEPSQSTASAKAAVRPPVRVATQRAPVRIRFHQEPPSTTPTPAAVQEAPLAPVVLATAPAEAPAKEASPPPAAPAPTPPVRTPAKPAPMTDVRGILTMLFDLGRHDRGKAPIEERTPGSAIRPPPTTAPVESARVAPPVAVEPARVAPPPVDIAYAMKPEPAPAIPPPPAFAREPAPRAVPPAPEGDLAAQGRRMLAESIPYSAARAQDELARVMWVAANARPGQDQSVADAVRRSWSNYQVVTTATSIAPSVARQLGEDARHAFLVDRDVARAYDLQLRAFGANPRDPELAGNLAFLLLKVKPMQAESARQLAVHAIALAASQRSGRPDDWTTLGVASALTGRDADAANALYVAIALSRNLDSSCRAAVAAVESHGERVAAPVAAMMARIREQGRERESSYCTMPARYANARGYY